MAHHDSESASPEGFEWDLDKARENENKHGVSFSEAAVVFEDLHSETLTVQDVGDEVREVTIGYSDRQRLIVAVHTETEAGVIRIISARVPSKRERRMYEEGVIE